MTNKRYTDQDIISSLKVIATTGNCNECKIRNCKWGSCSCSQITANAALDLINRQKAEIERLKGSVIVNNIMEIQKIKREAKFEAVKEFANKLKKHPRKMQSSDFSGEFWDAAVLVEDIDKIVKEVEDENNERDSI